jgi:L-amino acid N-acyltransferase YncA
VPSHKVIRTNIYGVVGEISDMPGCPQVAVSHYVFMKDGKKGEGWGQKAHRDRLSVMRGLGYDHAICTVVNGNAAERHILEKQGWKKVDEFKSSKTTNLVEIWTKSLSEIEYDNAENETYDYWERTLKYEEG